MIKRTILLVFLLLGLSCEAVNYVPLYVPVASGVTGTPILSSITLAGVNNNFTGDLGFGFNCTANFTMTYAQRMVLTGNTQDHTFKIKNSSGTVLTSVVIHTAGVTAGTYASSALSFSFVSGNQYFIESGEFNGGDSMYQGSGGTGCPATLDASIGVSLVASANASAAGTGTVYIPLNILH